MTKQTQIVCQHLENVAREALEEYQVILREQLRGRHGIYALYRDGSVHYVGLARNLRGRLRQHLRDRHKDDWDRFSVYLTIDNRAIKELETLLLRIVDPDGNRSGGRFIKSQNLAPLLIREARTRDREKLKHLAPRRRKTAPVAATIDNGEIQVALPPLAKYTIERPRLRAKYKGKLHRAVVRRDGRIRHDGVIYDSPSAAAIAVIGHNANGWQFWKYERAPGDWVPLKALRPR
jgi:hypothetical protein